MRKANSFCRWCDTCKVAITKQHKKATIAAPSNNGSAVRVLILKQITDIASILTIVRCQLSSVRSGAREAFLFVFIYVITLKIVIIPSTLIITVIVTKPFGDGIG